ncbi:hypothetical protein Pure04_00170 [Paenarthrobacter ureafaciens]|nr:hypothetical protein Pure02_03660 [Paenarthrobacter ureafaciens]GLU66390.1 hypothetical protein Pure03_03660 [Paenarthrobacter ureafaciens]GLU70302.1 hypothetical protein Pure04_00170 [Paenarthrobacter ureafaciens]
MVRKQLGLLEQPPGQVRAGFGDRRTAKALQILPLTVHCGPALRTQLNVLRMTRVAQAARFGPGRRTRQEFPTRH